MLLFHGSVPDLVQYLHVDRLKRLDRVNEIHANLHHQPLGGW